MEKAPKRLGAILKDLALACLNATLLLILLCVLLYYLAARKMEDVAESFARSVAVVTPLREDVASLTRTLADLNSTVTGPETGVTPQVEEQLDQLLGRVEMLHDRLDGIAQAPTRFLDHAIEKAAVEIRSTAERFRTCQALENGNVSRP